MKSAAAGIRRLLWVLALLAVVLVSAVALSQESRQGDRVLHRYLDPQKWIGGQGVQQGASAAAMNGEAGEAPGLGLSPGPEEWVWTERGPVGPGDLSAPQGPLGGGATELDDDTDRVDGLNYQASFDPSVVPWKRSIAQNRVRRQ